MSRPATALPMRVDIVLTRGFADALCEESDPLQLLMAAEDDGFDLSQISPYTSRSALLGDWTGRIFYGDFDPAY